MCIILLAENKHISKEILEKAELYNSDGSGIAWIDQKTNKVNWIKGLNVKAKTILKIVKKHKIQLPYIVHFRITSIGDTCDQLCHPFDLNAKLDQNDLIGSSDQGVLFHNGTSRNYEDHLKICFTLLHEKLPLGKMSDSRSMAYIANKDRYGLDYLSDCFKAQKIAVLTPNGIKKYGENWSKIEDLTMSNDHGMTYDSCDNFLYNDNYSGYYAQFDNNYNNKSICKTKKERINVKSFKNSKGKNKKLDNFHIKHIDNCNCNKCYQDNISKILESSNNDHKKYCDCKKCIKSLDKKIAKLQNDNETKDKFNLKTRKKVNKKAKNKLKIHLKKLDRLNHIRNIDQEIEDQQINRNVVKDLDDISNNPEITLSIDNELSKKDIIDFYQIDQAQYQELYDLNKNDIKTNLEKKVSELNEFYNDQELKARCLT